MDERQWLLEQFEAERPHLRAVAYRMLGSLAEAEDAVQEAWLHFSRSDTSTVSNLGGWLTTVVARVCLNMLHAREARREESLETFVYGPMPGREGGIALKKKRCWPIRLVSRCWWFSTRSLLPNASPSCCTTSLVCPSTKSPLSWSVPRPRRDNSPVAHAAGYEERRGLPMPISLTSERS